MHPITHHDILGLVEPFTRRGRHVDLGASNRMERRLRFKPIAHGQGSPSALVLQDTLQLDITDPGNFVLTRTLTAGDGLQATLQSIGRNLAELLASVEAVDPQSQFRAGPNCSIAFSQRLKPLSADALAATAAAQPVLTHAEARIDGMVLAMKVPTVHGYAAELALTPSRECAFEWPRDLLAVLGWDWARLDRVGGNWRSTLTLHGKEPERSRRAERQFEEAAKHLARTLAEPPACFHSRLAAKRWRVAFRHALPMLSVVGLIGAALAVPQLAVSQDSPLRMLIFNGPPLLLALGVCMKEMPRFEIPRFPRPSRAPSWLAPPAEMSTTTTP